MDEKFTMDVLETMAQMMEVLVARIELLEIKLNELCSCQRWASNFRPGVVIPPMDDGMFLSQREVDDLLHGVTSENPNEIGDWAEALREMTAEKRN